MHALHRIAYMGERKWYVTGLYMQSTILQTRHLSFPMALLSIIVLYHTEERSGDFIHINEGMENVTKVVLCGIELLVGTITMYSSRLLRDTHHSFLSKLI